MGYDCDSDFTDGTNGDVFVLKEEVGFAEGACIPHET
jgi:hypothetical protein